MIVYLRSQTIVSTDPKIFDEKVNDFLNDTNAMFESKYGEEEYDLTIMPTNMVCTFADPQHDTYAINYLVEISEREEEEL